ncbi:MAG: hypothetical protein COT81_00845 [Candidatus Buchananbacteria bacterium CG10_big_fil_rev_8_21_14_0_10_42_9]|uniref:Glycosyltransferase subfamily 4-like N-terminal domain-containing protein n=1 Tax=Candidatus Buchananbacteria bacterium CG10_big_fil_rev_8_21_14_0_10_42_9 TaxID=1974526 RepID=A0A2H0W2I5_9BACT|nr:MAG: hypothetical protein COT81_00845 [Candidatus Buchananbacteria bacterium CG10_big_fil_rev_8_21_14_0_10_42_9]
MKIVLINSLYYPNSRGGAEVIAKATADGLSRAGHEVHVVTSGEKDSQEKVGGVIVHRIKPANLFSYITINEKPFWLRLPWHFIDMFSKSGPNQAQIILQKVNPHVVITHNLKGIGYRTVKMIRKIKVRHIHILHDVQLVKPSGLIKKGKERLGLLSRIYAYFTKRLFGSPDVVVSPSAWLMEFYNCRNFFKQSRKQVLNNPVLLNLSGHKRLLDSHNFHLLYIGQLERHKGILFLVDVLKTLPANNFTLTIVGKGSLHMLVQDKVKNDNRFRFLGYIQPNQVEELYQSIDASIVPSLCYENSPAVISQSLAAQVPVITSDIGGAGEMITNGINGYKFEAGNQKELLAILQSMTKEDIDQMSRNCAEYSDRFSVQNYVKSLEKLLQN